MTKHSGVRKKHEKLTERQRAFVREYVIDLNGKEAAIRAGYSEKTAKQGANQILGNPLVQDEIKRLTAQKQIRSEIQTDEIIGALGNILRADVRDVISWGNRLTHVELNGASVEVEMPFVSALPSEDLDPAVAAAISEVSMSKDGTFKVKMHSKTDAIDKLMKHFGLYEADNKQKTDPLAELIKAAQGTALPIATRAPVEAAGGSDE